MPGNSFGMLFKVATFGESHGSGVGVIVDGVTPGLELCEADIQHEMDRRKPGQSDVTTPRKEPDRVHILSGVFEGKTTGTPLCMLLYNADVRSTDYDAIKDLYRPGHADFSYARKYGIRDYRGSGRASGRETAGRVAAGAVAKKSLSGRGVTIRAYTLRIGDIVCESFDLDEIERNPVRAPDPAAATRMRDLINDLAAQGDSCGGIIECTASGVQAGLGEPVFDKLEADLAKAMLSLGGVKGFEIGSGFGCVSMRGSTHNDWLSPEGFLSNHAGGVLGGISTGQEIRFRIAVKPTSSISRPQRTIDVNGVEQEIRTEGRHDPCLCPRLVPVVEAMAALVLEDHCKRQAALHG